ncbi:epimerase [Gemmatimonadetes bacterium T265]|nr:epimerase [Gemmatimonadetes bacterium T265]
MVGQGVLLECLRGPGVEHVLAVGRSPTGRQDPKLRDLVIPDVADLSSVAAEFTDFDACFFCLGVSAAGLSEARYTALTYDLTLAVAETLVRASPALTFVYVSGQGTDATERGRTMWARVKGRTENALQRVGFRAIYLFRPGLIVPLDGIRSRTWWYRALYAALGPALPLLRRRFLQAVTTTAQVGRAMLAVARGGAPTPVLETRDINAR